MRLRLLSLFICLVLFSGTVFGTVWCNWFTCAYGGECPKLSGGSSFVGIKSGGYMSTLVTIGAGNFLSSYSDFQAFLKRYELSELQGICFEEMDSILSSCITSMENTNVMYYELKTIAALIPYNQVVISKLNSFDYDGFLQGRKLNPAVFQEVREFLSKGDVTGSVRSIYSKTCFILPLLYRIKFDIDRKTLPEISNLWELNQAYSNSLLFGQYIAWIFKSIL